MVCLVEGICRNFQNGKTACVIDMAALIVLDKGLIKIKR